MRTKLPLAGEGRSTDGLADAFRREVAAALLLLEGAAAHDGALALTPVRFRFVSTFPPMAGRRPGEPNRSPEIVITIGSAGLETVEPTALVMGDGGADYGR